jgi:transposase-like protein
MERRKFGREFKLEAVRLTRDRGVSYAQAARDLSVHLSQLRNWVKAFWWKGAADGFLVACYPAKKHGPWVVAHVRVVTPSGDPV